MASTAAARTEFVPIGNANELAEWLQQPGVGLLFLHDPGCPISTLAYWEVADIGGAVAYADVRAAPALANEVERRTGLRHESPQAIVLRDGRPVWSASHFGVTSDAVSEALEEAGVGGQVAEGRRQTDINPESTLDS